MSLPVLTCAPEHRPTQSTLPTPEAEPLRTKRFRPNAHFWEAFGTKVLLVGDTGLAFTRQGAAELGEVFASCAIDIKSVRTVAAFRDAIRICNQYAFEENDMLLELAYHQEDTSDTDKVFIEEVLGFMPPVPLDLDAEGDIGEYGDTDFGEDADSGFCDEMVSERLALGNRKSSAEKEVGSENRPSA